MENLSGQLNYGRDQYLDSTGKMERSVNNLIYKDGNRKINCPQRRAVKIEWPERLVQKDENGRFGRLTQKTHPGSWISQKASFVDR